MPSHGPAKNPVRLSSIAKIAVSLKLIVKDPLYFIGNLTSESELKKLLNKQKTSKKQQRIQVLYLLKIDRAESIGHLACLIGRHKVTVSSGPRLYRQGGLDRLLEIGKSSGRNSLISANIKEKLKEELQDPEGFDSYKEIQLCLKSIYNIEASYYTIHKTVRYQLKSKLKIPRPVNIKQAKNAVDEFNDVPYKNKEVLFV